jgi:hypothetical protein
MRFINPMWDNESERIGKQRCTPLGYTLHVISDLIGFVGLLLLFATGAYLGYRGIVGTFHTGLLWFFAIPFGLAFIGSALFNYSWLLARRKGFRYDYDAREASWIENGERQTYRWTA